jgi:hypothetical protein
MRDKRGLMSRPGPPAMKLERGFSALWMRRLIAVALFASVVGGFVTTQASAHKLPISYAKKKAKKIIQDHFRDDPWQFRGTITARATACRRLSEHKVRCKAYAEGFDPALDETLYCRGRVTVRFVFRDSYITDGRVTGAVCF